MKKLGFGLMRLPKMDNDDPSSVDLEAVKVMADAFLAKGFTYFDTAAPYHRGHSEVVFREAVVKRYPRSAYTITDKLSLFMIDRPEDIPGFFDAQMERLGVDYLDYYLLHALGEKSYRKAIDFGAFDFVRRLKEEGRVKHIGFSFHDKAELLDEILTKYPQMEYVQLQLNYLDWEDASVQSRLCHEVAIKHNKPVIVMEPVKGGSLAHIPEEAAALLKQSAPDMSIASWAIRFAASAGDIMVVLSGMSDMAQLEDNMSYMDDFIPMNQSEREIVLKAAEIVRNTTAIPCTTCRYCVDDCPKQIAIPDYFNIYNNVKRFGGFTRNNARNSYENLTKTHAKASECIKCGLCESHCPQHLSIRSFLEDVAGELE